MNAKILTIGHSTHSYSSFLRLLRLAGADAVADVRSSPYSRHYPHFNKPSLQSDLRLDGLAYVFLGEELGGRPVNKNYYTAGVADYELMAKDPGFRRGLDRVMQGSQKFRIALMCSEHDPLDCHRCLLVGRALKESGAVVNHILTSGSVKSQADVESELLAALGAGQEQDDFFVPYGDRVRTAYIARSRKVAFSLNAPSNAEVAVKD